MATEAQLKSNLKHQKEKLDGIKLWVPKGQRAVIQAHAKAMGESTNAFIRRAIAAQIEHDEKNVQSAEK